MLSYDHQKQAKLRLLVLLKLEMRRHSDVDVHEYLYSSGRTELLHHVLKFPGKPATSRRHPFGKSGTTLKLARIRNLQSQDWTTCHGCPLTKVCGRRNCSAFKYGGNYTDFDSSHGQIAYHRFKDYGVSKPPCLANESEPA